MPNYKINTFVRWWMTPELPPQDIYDLPLLKDKSALAKYSFLFSQWLIHPIKRRLARYYFESFKKYTTIKVIGVTGSAGKSTTVQMLKEVLSLDGPTVATPHSVDPVYNIPNTILAVKPGTKYLILEMSVEYPGEMDYYLWLGKPDIGVILNIYPTHLSSFGNVEGVLKEKSKLVKNLDESGTAVLNGNNKLLKGLENKLDFKTVWFEGVSDPLISNINAVKAVAKVLGIKKELLDKGLNNFKTPNHRLQLIKLKNNINILDDTYNSNPEAAIAAVDYFNKISGSKKIAIVGDMLEMGSFDKEAHRLLGKKLAASGFEIVVGVGKSITETLDILKKSSKSTLIYHAKNASDAADFVKARIKKDRNIFIKGSRSIGLDKVVSELSSPA